MRPHDRDAVFSRAASAYERARWWRGARAALLVLPLTAVSLVWSRNPTVSVVIAVALAAAVVLFVRAGGLTARAVVPGLSAGVVPLVLPLVACPSCSTLPTGASLLVCASGGVLSAAILASFALHARRDRIPFAIAAGAIAGLAGSLGCVVVGLAGVVAMAAALLVMTPVALRFAPTGGA